MCFHASQTKRVPELEERYEAKRNEVFEIQDTDFMGYHLNGFSHPELLVIPQESPFELHPSIWGIIPKGKSAADQNEYYKVQARYGGGLNARSEKLFDYYVYKDSIYEKRCIIPLTGFFEPHDHNGKKIPFYFSDAQDGVLSVAGIYSITRDGALTMTMITKEASPLFAKIHNTKKRQIVLLDRELEREWLRPDMNEKHIKELINVEYDDKTLSTYPVTQDLFKTKVETNNSEIIRQKEYPELGFVESLKN
ncbi:SOS response-associated peptidase [Aquimarina mytili]|uniref:Abasic site processing protein n=1 Tax=Aquimarina mytili TaxID=874423 RepID=A0A937A226_9FLAO|nr:SOS response-associated peptidase family protein [Aquimarina mytili]MBL0686040.1 SOS response-associated peptidase family protein [Aquimarina mytili]